MPEFYYSDEKAMSDVPFVTIEDAEEFIAEVDFDGNGKLSMEEFVKLMMEMKLVGEDAVESNINSFN